jgi:hypothetical protein
MQQKHTHECTLVQAGMALMHTYGYAAPCTAPEATRMCSPSGAAAPAPPPTVDITTTSPSHAHADTLFQRERASKIQSHHICLPVTAILSNMGTSRQGHVGWGYKTAHASAATKDATRCRK